MKTYFVGMYQYRKGKKIKAYRDNHYFVNKKHSIFPVDLSLFKSLIQTRERGFYSINILGM